MNKERELFQIDQRLKFKYMRKDLENRENQRQSMVETVREIKKYKKEKVKVIKDRLSVYTKHHVVPTLEEHSTKTFNQFSKVYQIQINTDRLLDLITHRNILALKDLPYREEEERNEAL